MVEYKQGNLFDEPVEALVNTVNCVGVMGRGIALQFKQSFPGNYQAYAAACSGNEVQPGRMFVYATGATTGLRYIINFPTKRHWRNGSRMEDVESGLAALVAAVRERGIRSLAVPALGCGLGGLDWHEVRPRIEAALAPLAEVRVVVFEPAPEPRAGPAPSTSSAGRGSPRLTPGRAALVELVRRYREALLSPNVTMREVHLLLYLLQTRGEPLHLHFQVTAQGLQAANLGPVLSQMQGSFLTGGAGAAADLEEPVELVPGAAAAVAACLLAHPATGERVERVVRLLEGFESPHGLALLVAVLRCAGEERLAGTEAAVTRALAGDGCAWQATPRQVEVARTRLLDQQWVGSLSGRP